MGIGSETTRLTTEMALASDTFVPSGNISVLDLQVVFSEAENSIVGRSFWACRNKKLDVILCHFDILTWEQTLILCLRHRFCPMHRHERAMHRNFVAPGL